MDQLLVFNIVELFFRIYTYMILGYILMSWFPNLRESAVGQFLARFVEPILTPFRKIIPPLGMIDISPIVALIALRLAESGAIALVRILYNVIGA